MVPGRGTGGIARRGWAGQRLAGLGEFGAALEGVRGYGEPVVLLVLLLGAGLFLERGGRLGGQPQAGTQLVRFTGVDGARWFLRGVFSGAAAENPAAAAPLEAVMREVVVVRGEHPVPPRDLLELRLPPEAAAALEEQAKAQQEEQNRFATQPNPFERGPEITETR